MASIKFALFFVALLGLLLQAYHARHLQDVIQMVTQEEDLQSPPSSPSFQDKSTYGRVNPPPPPPKGAPSTGHTTYGRDNPKAPPSPKPAPPQVQIVYVKENPSPNDAPSQGETTYGRDNPKAPSPPNVAPSRGQTTYGENNPIQTTSSQELADLLDILSQIPDSSTDHITYGRDDPTKPPTPDPNGSEGHGMYGRDDLTKPPTPDSNGSEGHGMYGRDDPTKPLTPDPNGSEGQGMYSRDGPTEPFSPDSNGSKGQGMYGRDNPSTNTFKTNRPNTPSQKSVALRTLPLTWPLMSLG